MAGLDLVKRSLRRFLEVGNGKETPENALISRFYTAWADSGPIVASDSDALPPSDFW